MYERMSIFTSSLTVPGPPSGMVSRILVKRPRRPSFSQWDRNGDPLIAGPRSEPMSPTLWQREQLKSNAAFPRAACSELYTPSQRRLAGACSGSAGTVRAKPMTIEAIKNNSRLPEPALLLSCGRGRNGNPIPGHQVAKQSGGLRVAASTAASASTCASSAGSLRNIQRSAALFVLSVQPGAVIGGILNNVDSSTSRGIMQNTLAVGVEGIDIDAVFDE